MWDAFKQLIFDAVNALYGVFGDWGMAIMVATLIFRLVLMPLMQRQIKSSYDMQKMQPLMQDIQARYADDQPRMQEEMQKLYAEAHFNPLAGCLPILLQMPIFMALFQVLQNMPTYIGGTTAYNFYSIIPDLTYSPSSSLEHGVLAFIPYLILLIIFAGATFLPMILQQMNTPASDQKRQTLIMSAFMSLFMLWIGWGSPGGVLLFWGVSSLFGVAQQQLTMRHLRRKDAEAEAEEVDTKPVVVDVTRKEKKKRPRKSR